MEMQVRYALTGLLPDVGHHPVTLQTQLLGDLGDHGKDVATTAALSSLTSATEEICILGITRKWVGAWGSMS